MRSSFSCFTSLMSPESREINTAEIAVLTVSNGLQQHLLQAHFFAQAIHGGGVYFSRHECQGIRRAGCTSPTASFSQFVATDQASGNAGGECVTGANGVQRLDTGCEQTPASLAVKSQGRGPACRDDNADSTAFPQYLHSVQDRALIS